MAKTVSGTREWAPVNANCSSGCSHDCRYCYAKCMAIRFKRKTPETWRDEEVYLHRACQVARMSPTRVMFPTTHDITPATLDTCMLAMAFMLGGGHELLIVSKPHLGCVKAICKVFTSFRSRILFRFTIGSAAPSVLAFWEPHAPEPEERVLALKLAHAGGYRTSVSCEPMLDANVEAVVAAVEPFVTDTIWLGKANLLRQRLSVNGHHDPETTRRAAALTRSQCDERIRALYEKLKAHPKVRWKDSIKKALGLGRPAEPGLDV